jgi:hypothetical protein
MSKTKSEWDKGEPGDFSLNSKPYPISKDKLMNHCLQCGEELKIHDLQPKWCEVPYCINVECPNYGLFQMGIENMPVSY